MDARIDRRSVLMLGAALGVEACGIFAPRPPRLTRLNIPGMAVARLKRGHPTVFEERGDLGSDTVLEVASLSKPLFAYALIVESLRGHLDLDAPLGTLCPLPYEHAQLRTVDLLTDPRFAAITPRMILSHQTGLPNWSRTAPLAFEATPPQPFHYSGEAYVLLQKAIERKGLGLDAFVRRAVFDPLGMSRSTYAPQRATTPASGHDRSGARVPSTQTGENAATSLYSTAADLARFVRHLIDPPTLDATVRTMMTPQVEVDRSLRLSWGLGIGLAEPEWFFHWGANPGFRSLLVGSRDRAEAVVVVTDSDAGMEAAAGDIRDVFGDLPLLRFPLLYPPD